MQQAAARMGLSARAQHRICRVARTVAIWPALSGLALPIWLKPSATGGWKADPQAVRAACGMRAFAMGRWEGFAQTRCQAAQAGGQTRLRTRFMPSPVCAENRTTESLLATTSPASPRKALRAFMRSLCVGLSALVQQPQHRRTQAPGSPSQRTNWTSRSVGAPYIEHQHDASEDVPLAKILFDDACPHSLLVTRRARKTVAGRSTGSRLRAAGRSSVPASGPASCWRKPCGFALPGRLMELDLPGVGAAGEGDSGPLGGGKPSRSTTDFSKCGPANCGIRSSRASAASGVRLARALCVVHAAASQSYNFRLLSGAVG